MNRIAATILIALMFVMALAVPVLAQDGCAVVGTIPGGSILFCPDSVAPTATPEPATPTPTATAIPATPEPTATQVPPTATATPTATPAATATAIPAPTGAAWQCPESAHDKSTWHPHYNSQLRCWYDHVHGANPADMAYRFGAPWSFLANYPGYDASKSEWNFGTISYPWLTGNGMEQSMKHGGYKWQIADVAPQNANVLKIPPATDLGYNWVADGPTWNLVTSFRYQEHFGNAFAGTDGMPAMFDSHTRVHSFWLELATGDGAIIGGGGHWDTGRFWKYGTRIIPMPDIDPNPVSPRQTGLDGHFSDPYRGDGALCGEAPYGVATTALWTSRPPWIPSEGYVGYDYKHNNHMGLFSLHKDIAFCTADDGTQHQICKPGDTCPWANNTDFAPFKVWAYLSPSYDNSAVDRNPAKGRVTMYTWTTRYGLPAAGCTAPGLDCVPFYAVDARPGWYGWTTNKGQPYVESIDYDQSPAGRSYINLWGN